jgi:uncharacterized protein
MLLTNSENIVRDFHAFISDDSYPCVAARAAMNREQVPCLIAGHIGCPADDAGILDFLHDFVKRFRKANTLLHSAAVIFTGPRELTEEAFDHFMWNRLQALSNLDAQTFAYDKRVSPDPSQPTFSFSLAEEAFFIIGLHPASSRRSRQFRYPAIVFNPHVQFQQLRENNRYEKMKDIVRRRDTLYSGSINPMLKDFGEASEAYQYSGRQYSAEWSCPFKRAHEQPEDHPAAK